MKTWLLSLILCFSPLTFASTQFAFTRDLLYAAADDATVSGGGFHSISIDEAKSRLLEQIKQSCGERDPAQVTWETWTENIASYGRQQYWMRGNFKCLPFANK